MPYSEANRKRARPNPPEQHQSYPSGGIGVAIDTNRVIFVIARSLSIFTPTAQTHYMIAVCELAAQRDQCGFMGAFGCSAILHAWNGKFERPVLGERM